MKLPLGGFFCTKQNPVERRNLIMNNEFKGSKPFWAIWAIFALLALGYVLGQREVRHQ